MSVHRYGIALYGHARGDALLANLGRIALATTRAASRQYYLFPESTDVYSSPFR